MTGSTALLVLGGVLEVDEGIEEDDEDVDAEDDDNDEELEELELDNDELEVLGLSRLPKPSEKPGIDVVDEESVDEEMPNTGGWEVVLLTGAPNRGADGGSLAAPMANRPLSTGPRFLIIRLTSEWSRRTT